MSTFPTTFSQPTPLDPTELSAEGAAAYQVLTSRGYALELGLAEADVQSLAQLSQQPSILEYCPNDCRTRFKDVETAAHWFTKGRLVFLLKAQASGEIAGYGWSGPGTTEHIPEGTLTAAVRLSEAHQGKGLAAPFLQVLGDYTTGYAPHERLWLEGWESNAGAIHIYQKLGFRHVTSQPASRPTANGGVVNDTRLYMQLAP